MEGERKGPGAVPAEAGVVGFEADADFFAFRAGLEFDLNALGVVAALL